MKKKAIFVINILILAGIIPFVVSAGDEENPEITDVERDLEGLFGMIFPGFFKHIDIISGWFYENSSAPDDLYVCLKVKNLEYKKMRSIYSIHWEYNGKEYAVGIHTDSFGDFFLAFGGCMDPGNESMFEIDADFNTGNEIITWTVPKIYIGDPQPDDVLENTLAWNGLRFVSDEWLERYIRITGESELAKDWAIGSDYIIQL